MKRKPTFESWIAELRKIIATKKPRSTMQPLRQLEAQFLQLFPTQAFKEKAAGSSISSGQLVTLFQTLIELRNSRCNARLDFEASIIRSIRWNLMDVVFIDDPNDCDGELIPNFTPPTDEQKAELFKLFELAGAHAHQILSLKPIKLKDYRKLIENTYDLLELILKRPEQKSLLENCLDSTLNRLFTLDPEYGYRAIEFLDAYYYKYGEQHKLPVKLIKQLEELSTNTKHENTAYAINKLLVDLGIISEFAAMDAMDEFRGEGG